MGSIYRPKYKRRDGAVVQSQVYWIKWYRNGRAFQESTDSDKEGVARKLLRQREGDVERGVPVTPQTNRVTFDELADDVLTDYKVNAKRSEKNVERSFTKYLRPYFAGRRAAGISTADVRKYIAQRQAAGAKNATINRELAAMKRAFSLGIEANKVTQKPKISMLRENNVRTGFFEPAQFEAVCDALPADLQPVVAFAYLTGWRTQAEVLPLQWRQIDFAAGTVRLDPGTTKNGEGRVFPMTAALRALLEAQHAHTEAVQREQGSIIPHVFHRNSRRVRYFQKAWRNACKAAGCPGRILHDFRRTAVRNLVRAGIPERVAMQMTGHKTRSVFERYNIVSEGDLADAVRRLDEAGKNLTGKVTGKVGAVEPHTPAAASRK
jgi:integrase